MMGTCLINEGKQQWVTFALGWVTVSVLGHVSNSEFVFVIRLS